ncbi:hypothetical protein N7491_006719 [Penicillium cf. griseofulvum]|uniref:Uncharacterized protein n=1 Tax=Penicillium cf. griseofulvum TaxID=2972120 RepID=A0A9W9IUQ2_9EURO|nr:hypothetical protein N7472_010254 [Penicillium cf. griseofulvum]KAJ5429703.1 hypothetical protein N7491_006719 [Penicillium cf. griseofulvum]KAJ5436530.1 hypothetical protein N7445_007415 [Penicillium cf. griseofulvum]
MEIEPDCIISSESFDKYVLDERRRTSKERVQDFLDRGLMSQVAVYQRFTEELSERLTSFKRSDQPAVIEDIRQSFRRLCDPTNGYLSKAMFKRLVAERLSEFGVNESPNAPALLFKVCSSHAFYPFPASDSGSEQAGIDEDGFVRAVCLLTLSPVQRHGTQVPGTVHRYSSGNWGPHGGWYIAIRGKDASDFRRRLFRSLALPASSGTSTSYDTKITVPRFIWFESKKEEVDSEPEPDQQVVVTEDESELSIDIVDVLSECPPKADTLTANPFRESYRIVLPSLPKQTGDLSMLFIPRIELVALLKLVHQVQGENSVDSAAAIRGLGNEEKISWKRFDSALSEQSVS